jgi:hypothetical protein
MSVKLSPPRRGATLVELIVGIAIAMVVVGLSVAHVVRHQRASSAVTDAVNLRTRLRDASDILAADMRGISPIGDSVLVASDTAVEFYSSIGTSTLCTTASVNRLTLPPDSLPSGRTLSTWITSPDTGDHVLVFMRVPPSPVATWQRARITSVATVSVGIACPLSIGLLAAGDMAASARAYDFTLASAVPPATGRGAPVRVVRRVRYSIYRAGDGKWYLGYRRCSGGCSPIQPVSGPYDSHGPPPLTFRYFTRNGAPLAGQGPSADVGRMEIVARAAYARPFRLPGMTAALTSDSIVTNVTLRNRW